MSRHHSSDSGIIWTMAELHHFEESSMISDTTDCTQPIAYDTPSFRHVPSTVYTSGQPPIHPRESRLVAPACRRLRLCALVSRIVPPLVGCKNVRNHPDKSTGAVG